MMLWMLGLKGYQLKKTKQLPKWLKDELGLLGWKNEGHGLTDGFIWVREGIMLHIVPAEKMPRMYHVTREKMSERDVMFVHEPQLLTLIEGDSNE